MSSQFEYLFAASITIADQAARKKGWRPCGRTTWLKADGTTVCYIGMPAGAKVHRVRAKANRKRAYLR